MAARWPQFQARARRHTECMARASNAEMRPRRPVPSGCSQKASLLRCSACGYARYPLRLAPRIHAFWGGNAYVTASPTDSWCAPCIPLSPSIRRPTGLFTPRVEPCSCLPRPPSGRSIRPYHKAIAILSQPARDFATREHTREWTFSEAGASRPPAAKPQNLSTSDHFGGRRIASLRGAAPGRASVNRRRRARRGSAAPRRLRTTRRRPASARRAGP